MLDINMEFHKGILFVELDGELSFKTPLFYNLQVV